MTQRHSRPIHLLHLRFLPMLNLLILCCIQSVSITLSYFFLINDHSYKEGKGGEGESFEGFAGAGEERGKLPFPLN